MSQPRPPRPTRREILAAGSLALAAAATGAARRTARAAASGPTFTDDIIVDIHCHVFATSDLPVVGFVAHFIPGLSDFSREVWRFPEKAARALLEKAAKLPTAAVPSADDETKSLAQSLANRSSIQPVPKLPEGARKAALDEILGRLKLGWLTGSDTRAMLDRYIDTLYLVSHGRANIAASLAEAYPTVTLFTPCLVDFDRWSDDAAKTDLSAQIAVQSMISRLSTKGLIQRSDARFHPFVAFDPKREVEYPSGPTTLPAPKAAGPDGGASDGGSAAAASCVPTPLPAFKSAKTGAIDLVRIAVESSGFLGVKMYPPVGFAPLDNATLRSGEPDAAKIDAALRSLYTYCQLNEVPVTAHTSPGNEYGLGFRDLVSPERWRPVLRDYPQLRLNMAHFGHDYGVDSDPEKGIAVCEAWCNQAGDLMQRYAHVFADVADTSAVHDDAYLKRYAAILKALAVRYPRIKKRIMYGTDWWLNRLEEGADRFPTKVPELFAAAGFSASEVADVMGRNALRFLGFLDDDNAVNPGAAARRLRAFYAAADATPPPWVAG